MTLPPCWYRKMFTAALLAFSTAATTLVLRPVQAQVLNQLLPDYVSGENAEPDVTVVSRARTSYQSLGIHAGTFTIRPLISESLGYESNVLGLPKARGSTLLLTNASIDISSDNSHGSVNTGLVVADNRYLDLANQSFTDWTAKLGGSYNLGRDSASILFVHQNLNQTQRDLDVPQLDAPLPFTIDTTRLNYRTTFNRLSLTPGVELARYAFSSGLSGSTIYDQSYRNRL